MNTEADTTKNDRALNVSEKTQRLANNIETVLADVLPEILAESQSYEASQLMSKGERFIDALRTCSKAMR